MVGETKVRCIEIDLSDLVLHYTVNGAAAAAQVGLGYVL